MSPFAGGDQVLVMMNGKRFNRSALVQTFVGGDTALSFGSHGPDISSIPSSAIKNFQILRDSATSQYGSDAIAGVMNFGPRDNAEGLEVLARYGKASTPMMGKALKSALTGALALARAGSSTSAPSILTIKAPAAARVALQQSCLSNKIPALPANCLTIQVQIRLGVRRPRLAGKL